MYCKDLFKQASVICLSTILLVSLRYCPLLYLRSSHCEMQILFDTTSVIIYHHVPRILARCHFLH